MKFCIDYGLEDVGLYNSMSWQRWSILISHFLIILLSSFYMYMYFHDEINSDFCLKNFSNFLKSIPRFFGRFLVSFFLLWSPSHHKSHRKLMSLVNSLNFDLKPISFSNLRETKHRSFVHVSYCLAVLQQNNLNYQK